MIQFLLQKYNRKLGLFQIQSAEAIHNEDVFLCFNFSYAEKIFRWFVLGWLFYQLGLYYSISDRPEELFTPMIILSNWVMPEFPSFGKYISISLLALVCNICCMLGKGKILTRTILFIAIWYLNILYWSYGFFSHVGHFFVLINLFLIFIPDSKISLPFKKISDRAGAIKWLFVGLMVTYTMAGFWKIVGLLARISVSKEGISWLSNDAALYNAISGYKYWDMSLDTWMIDILTIPYLWPFMVLLMILLQLTSVFVAFRLPLFYWIGYGTIAFHVFNTLFMKVEFFVTPMVLAILFFPFHLLFKNKYKKQLIPVLERRFIGKGSSAIYIRKYENSKDVYTSFYALRERYYDEGKWFAAFLYIPGVVLFTTVVWSLFSNKNKGISIENILEKDYQLELRK
jgi:hypothetical protein